MPEYTRRSSLASSSRSRSDVSGVGGGRGWGKLRKRLEHAVRNEDNNDGAASRRPNLLNTMKLNSFRFSTRHLTRGEEDLPEEGGDLHKHFRTCASLTRIREEFRNALCDDAGRKMGFGMNACARPEEKTGRLLLHSIGLNSNLITGGGGSTAAALSRVNQFVLKELLQAFPAAMVEEDDNGHTPFIEPIVQWIEARRALRKWKLDTDRTRQKVALVATKLRSTTTARRAAQNQNHYDSDSEDSHSLGARHSSWATKQRSTLRSWVSGENEEKLVRKQLKMIVDSSEDAVFCIDEEGVILLTNDAAVKQFGHSKKEMTGSNISMICNSKDAPRHGSYLERYVKTGEKRVMGKKRELLARRKDGSTFYIELGLTEVHLGGGKFIFCGFVKDVTELKRHRKTLAIAPSNVSNPTQDNVEKIGGRRHVRGVPTLVEWCLTILSEFVDNYGFSKPGQTEHGDDDDSSLSSSVSDNDLSASFTNVRKPESSQVAMWDAMVVDKVASIPHLLEELLLVEDPEARSRVFDTSIVHKVLFNTDSLGDGKWLIQMLDKSITVQKQKILDANLTGADADTAEGRAFQLQLKVAQDECRFLAEGAVFYLEQVSELNIQDDLYVFHHVRMHQEVTHQNLGRVAEMISTGDVHHFQKNRDELFDAIGDLDGLIRRICVLEDDLVKRAAATPVMRRVLDKVMFSPFATLAALFDAINHFLLMISFRLGPAPALFHLSKYDDSFHHQKYLIASATLVASVVYFGTKVIHTGLAKYAVSENLFWSDAFTFWSFLETVPLLMVLFCSTAVDMVLRHREHVEVEDDNHIPFFLRIAIAMTTPFLWLRIMGFVKVRNKQLATFILCAVEIMKDIKWFLLVLFAAMASFAQMWVSFTYEPNQLENQYYMEGYLKAYTMMLGDLDSDSLKTHPLIAVLFVIYTFGVTVVLLNILIAIVSDSYQNSFSTSKMMLGKARIMFVSELMSIKSFHWMWMEGKTGSTRQNINFAFGLYAIFHVWMITGTINDKLRQDSHCEVGTNLAGAVTSTSDQKTLTKLKDILRNYTKSGQNSICKTAALSPNTIKLEAVLVFLILFFMIFAMKKVIVYVLNEFTDTGGLKHPGLDKRSTPRSQRALNWVVKTTFSTLSNSFDSLFDREDTPKKLGATSTSSQEHRIDDAIQRSIEKTRKTLKAELKVMFEQLQISLRDHQNENQADVSKIAEQISELVESQQLMAHALLSVGSDGIGDVSLDGSELDEFSQDENEGTSENGMSQSSLSLT